MSIHDFFDLLCTRYASFLIVIPMEKKLQMRDM